MHDFLVKNKNRIIKFLAIIFWILVWEGVSLLLQDNILLASPYQMVVALLRLVRTSSFWSAVLGSFLRISAGFILALVVGFALALLSYANRIVCELLMPLMKLIKAIPVASFVIIALLWIRSEDLPILISFLMVLPVIYLNIYHGFTSTDKKLLEMAKVFRMSKPTKMRMIFMPALKPHLISACSIGLGFCWKSGVAAEVIALSNFSIGRKLYDAKLYLMTDELFALTFVIIVISILFEKAVMKVIRKVLK